MRKQSWQCLGWLVLLTGPAFSQTKKIDVLVLGGGTAAAIQSARMGAKTWLIEPTARLGGLPDGNGQLLVESNRQMPAGLWGEFRSELRKRLAETEKPTTGPNGETRFEPKTGAEIFQKLAEAESKRLTIFTNSHYQKIKKTDSGWQVELLLNGLPETVDAAVLVDGNGTVSAQAGASSAHFGDDHFGRTGIAVCDFQIQKQPVNQSEKRSLPSFFVPVGELISADMENLVVVNNPIFESKSANELANSLPVLLQIGQVAGIVASLAALTKKPPSVLPVRMIQSFMLSAGGYLMPFTDVPKSHSAFAAIQKIGATGLLRAKSELNFQPDSMVRRDDFLPYLMDFYPDFKPDFPKTGLLTPVEANQIFRALIEGGYCDADSEGGGGSCTAVLFEKNDSVKRWELALWLDRFLDPFAAREVDFQGNFLD